MSKFQLKPNETFSLKIQGCDRQFLPVPHPQVAQFVHAMEGGKAKVYRIKDSDSDQEYALKIMKRRHQDPALEEVCQNLDQFKQMAGLEVCERLCLSPTTAPEAIAQYPMLQYAILMPWIQGQSWFDILSSANTQKPMFDAQQSLQVAFNFSQIIYYLEQQDIAHCDLSAANIILKPNQLQIQLIDVEDLFTPAFLAPGYLPSGTAGYQHQTSSNGQWNANADRFSSAILIGEILGWCHAEVRAVAYGETYFDPAEMQSKNCQRFEILSHVIAQYDPSLATLLHQAWNAESLADCPSVETWHQVLSSLIPNSQTQVGQTTQNSSTTVFWKPLSTPTPSTGNPSVSYRPLQPAPTKPTSPVQWIPITLPPSPAPPSVQWISPDFPSLPKEEQ
jgi:serine/threonine protein kinase